MLSLLKKITSLAIIFSFCLLVSCNNIKKTSSNLPQTNQNKKANQVDDKNNEFQLLKENAIQAMQKDKLTDAITFFNKALLIHSDYEIDKYLDECYFERGEYFFSVGKIDEALVDLRKCYSNNPKAKSLLAVIENKINPKKDPIILPISPEIMAQANEAFSNGFVVYLYDPQPKSIKSFDQYSELKFSYILSDKATYDGSVSFHTFYVKPDGTVLFPLGDGNKNFDGFDWYNKTGVVSFWFDLNELYLVSFSVYLGKSIFTDNSKEQKLVQLSNILKYEVTN